MQIKITSIQIPLFFFQIILVALLASSAYADPLFHHKKAALPGSPLLSHEEPSARIIEKTVEVIKPVEIIKEVPVIRNVEVIKEVPVIRTVEVEKPVEVIRHVPIVRTVIQRVNVPYPVHIQRHIPYPVHVERHIPVPVTVERLHTPITTRTGTYPAPIPEPTPVDPTPIIPAKPHHFTAKLDHIKGLLKSHSIKKRSPILHKIKNKIKSKIHAKKNHIKSGLKHIFG